MLFILQALPDYLVRADAFDKGMHRIWTVGDRFRMYFGGRAGSKSGKRYTGGSAPRAQNSPLALPTCMPQSHPKKAQMTSNGSSHIGMPP